MNKLLKYHLTKGLTDFYRFKYDDAKKRNTILSLLVSIRPFIEAYQSYTNDFKGDILDLNYYPLNALYGDCSKVLHFKSELNLVFTQEYSPKRLKHDLKILSKAVLGKRTYSKIKNKAKNIFVC